MSDVRGEFVVLRCLSSFDRVVGYDELKCRVRMVSESVEVDDFPINFVPKGDGSFYSESFVMVLSECCDWDRIEEVGDDGYVLGDVDFDKYRRFGVSEEFVRVVDSALVVICI